MMIYLILLIFVLYLLTKSKTNEKFYGMNYIQHHAYLKCCNVLGCNHPRCKHFLLYNASPLNLIGIIYKKGNTNENIHKLYLHPVQ